MHRARSDARRCPRVRRAVPESAVMLEFTLRFKSASGSLRDLWEWDAASKTVIATIGGRTIEIPVCSRKPRHGAFYISRINEDAFKIAPSVFACIDGEFHARAEVWDALLPCIPVVLTHAPDDVAAEMSEL
jgi:hypothetical protein